MSVSYAKLNGQFLPLTLINFLLAVLVAYLVFTVTLGLSLYFDTLVIIVDTSLYSVIDEYDVTEEQREFNTL